MQIITNLTTLLLKYVVTMVTMTMVWNWLAS